MKSNQYIDVRACGAIGDGETDDTAAIQKALDTCRDGGGTVYFPPGWYAMRTVKVHSNTDLVIPVGARIVGWSHADA